MSTEIERYDRIVRTPLPAKIEYARVLADSGLLPAQYRRQPANLLWAIEFGEMLGLSPMAAITGVHVIEGKPTASAALISALVRRAGHKLRVRGDGAKAVAQIIRADDPDFVFESVWDMDRARQAGLSGKDVWKKYPAAMLKARAITEVARDACEEALCGVMYTPEELGAEVDDEGNPIRTLATPDSPIGGDGHPDYVAQAEAAADADEVREVWKAAAAAGRLDLDLKAKLTEIAAAKKNGAAPDEPETVDAELVDEETGEIREPAAEPEAEVKKPKARAS